MPRSISVMIPNSDNWFAVAASLSIGTKDVRLKVIREQKNGRVLRATSDYPEDLKIVQDRACEL